MSRRKRAVQRKILPDPVYKSELVAKLINCMMLNGKKSVAQKIVYSVMGDLKTRLHQDPLEVLQKAIDTLSPAVEVKSRRIGGATYPIPVEVRQTRRRSLALRWLIDAARKRSARAMQQNLANEIADIVEGRGAAMKKKEEVHRMAESNRAFSHFRF